MSDSLPAREQRQLESFLAEIRSSLGENLVSCILYGSAVRGGFVPGKSDINLLIVLRVSTPDAHDAIAQALGRNRRGIGTFVLGLPGIENSFRVFAVKFRSIQRHYRLLCGEDVLAGFRADGAHVRFLCEQSLRNLRLRSVHAFIESRPDARAYVNHVSHIVPLIFTDIGEVLRSHDIALPDEFAGRIPLIEEFFGASFPVLARLLALKEERGRPSWNEAMALHRQVNELLTRVLEWMDANWKP